MNFIFGNTVHISFSTLLDHIDSQKSKALLFDDLLVLDNKYIRSLGLCPVYFQPELYLCELLVYIYTLTDNKQEQINKIMEIMASQLKMSCLNLLRIISLLNKLYIVFVFLLTCNMQSIILWCCLIFTTKYYYCHH